jgi:hypothetical protein
MVEESTYIHRDDVCHGKEGCQAGPQLSGKPRISNLIGLRMLALLPGRCNVDVHVQIHPSGSTSQRKSARLDR